MSAHDFHEENDLEDFNPTAIIPAEASPTTKLERRRKIEDLFEEKRLQEELAEFG